MLMGEATSKIIPIWTEHEDRNYDTAGMKTLKEPKKKYRFM
jgi:hypothetical protein